MTKYIERETAIAKLTALEVTEPSATMIDAKRLLAEMPAADVVPVVHGEWLLRHEGYGHYWECSSCHKNPCIYVTKDTRYCPNCGAKMDEKGEEA